MPVTLTNNLTTLEKLKVFMGLDTDVIDSDDRLGFIINEVSGQIAAHTDRTFALTTYKRWYDGSGTNILRLPESPIIALYGVSFSSRFVGDLQYTGGGEWASATFNGSTLTLVDIDTSGTENINEISVASYPIMSLLSTQVATVSDWTLTVDSGESNQPTTLIRPFNNWAKQADSIDIEIPDESEEGRITSDSTDLIELRGTPFPKGQSNVFVWFKAGYTLPTDSGELTGNGTVPAGLELVCNQICSEVFYHAQRDPGLESERIGDYAYKLASGAVEQAVAGKGQELWPWRRKGI